VAHRLTDRQRLFVAAYLGPAKGNASEAARIAGYSHPAQVGSRLVHKSAVSEQIKAGLTEVALTSSQILANLSEIADGSLDDYLKVTTRGKVTLDLAKAKKAEKLRLIRKIKIDRNGEVQIELHDPIRALDLLGKYRNLFTDRDASTESTTRSNPLSPDEAEIASDAIANKRTDDDNSNNHPG
jgi:phage terminase small subunit